MVSDLVDVARPDSGAGEPQLRVADGSAIVPAPELGRRFASTLQFAPFAISGVVLLAGALGFRLRPDSSTYAHAHLSASPLGSGIGLAGGMPLLVVVSAIAAGYCVWSLPSTRGRLLFTVCGGFWLLFPGVDALGVSLVAWNLRRPLERRTWLPIFAAHAIAGLSALPALLERRRAVLSSIALVVVVALAFTLEAWLSGDRVGPFEHAAYTSRYLLVPLYLLAVRL